MPQNSRKTWTENYTQGKTYLHSKAKTEWFGYHLLSELIKPVDEKIEAITEKLRPKNLNNPRSFLGATNQMNKLISNLADLCAPLRPLLKRDQDWIWEADHEKAFIKINQATKMLELKHFKRNLPLRIIFDASKDGLGSVLQQKLEKGGTKHFCYAISN